jgi:hypothetical protein
LPKKGKIPLVDGVTNHNTPADSPVVTKVPTHTQVLCKLFDQGLDEEALAYSSQYQVELKHEWCHSENSSGSEGKSMRANVEGHMKLAAERRCALGAIIRA